MIGLLTYQTVHKKTIDTLYLLKATGYEDVIVFAFPLHYKKSFKPIYEHRPQIVESSVLNKIGYRQIIKNLGYKVIDVEDYNQINVDKETVFLVCGAGIIPNSFLEKHKVINSHPGYIPNVRGLDALKWAIVENEPIGVTTHYLGDYVDAGEIIKRKNVDIKLTDTFYEVAIKQYQLEIEMLVGAISSNSISLVTDGEGYIVHKRMPKDIEVNLIEIFEKYKLNVNKDI